MSVLRLPLLWLVLSHLVAVGVGMGIAHLDAARARAELSPTHATVARILPHWAALLAFRFGTIDHARNLLSVPSQSEARYGRQDAFWRHLRLAALARE